MLIEQRSYLWLSSSSSVCVWGSLLGTVILLLQLQSTGLCWYTFDRTIIQVKVAWLADLFIDDWSEKWGHVVREFPLCWDHVACHVCLCRRRWVAITNSLGSLLPKPWTVGWLVPILDFGSVYIYTRKRKKISHRMFWHMYGVLNEVYLQNFLHGWAVMCETNLMSLFN